MSTNTADFDKSPPPRIVVMGVSGSGKTTIGNTLAHRLGVTFGDADDFHSAANVEKMAGGQPLTDEDRWPWLEVIGKWLADHPDGAVIACSALRVAYRDAIRNHCADAYFVYLDGSKEVVTRRVAARMGHFMPAALVQSQFDALEPLAEHEAGSVVSFDQPVESIVTQALAAIVADRGGSA